MNTFQLPFTNRLGEAPIRYQYRGVVLLHDTYAGEVLLGETFRRKYDSIAFFCPDCGSIWARFIIPDHKHSILRRQCDGCGVGSLITRLTPHTLDLSQPLLEREIHLAAEHGQESYRRNSLHDLPKEPYL